MATDQYHLPASPLYKFKRDINELQSSTSQDGEALRQDVAEISAKIDKLLEQNLKIVSLMNELAELIRRTQPLHPSAFEPIPPLQQIPIQPRPPVPFTYQRTKDVRI